MNREPIAYTYGADTHCPPCAEERWGRCTDGHIACLEDDGEHPSPPGAIFSWDEWCDPEGDGVQLLACGTCYGVIEQHSHDHPSYALWRDEGGEA